MKDETGLVLGGGVDWRLRDGSRRAKVVRVGKSIVEDPEDGRDGEPFGDGGSVGTTYASARLAEREADAVVGEC